MCKTPSSNDDDTRIPHQHKVVPLLHFVFETIKSRQNCGSPQDTKLIIINEKLHTVHFTFGHTLPLRCTVGKHAADGRLITANCISVQRRSSTLFKG